MGGGDRSRPIEASARGPRSGTQRARQRQWTSPARTAIGVLALVAILFLFVFPTRSFLAQRSAVADAKHDVQVLREQNARLRDEAQRLTTPAEIERRARELHWLFPGEKSYRVKPLPETTTTTGQ
jgi:cell division protein FtsB